MKSCTLGLTGLLISLALAASARAQTPRNSSEDARIYYLRQADLCQLQIGAFIAVTEPEFAPSQADQALLRELYSVADRIIYEGERRTAEVGPVAAKAVLDELMVGFNARLHRNDAMTDMMAKGALLRADLVPDLRDCIAKALLLEKPPQ